MLMAFLLVSSWLPAHRKHADPSNRSTLRAITGEKAPLACKNPKSREESNGKRGRAHPWRPCSSPSCARGPSWTSGRCRRPWLVVVPPIWVLVREGLGSKFLMRPSCSVNSYPKLLLCESKQHFRVLLCLHICVHLVQFLQYIVLVSGHPVKIS